MFLNVSENKAIMRIKFNVNDMVGFEILELKLVHFYCLLCGTSYHM